MKLVSNNDANQEEDEIRKELVEVVDQIKSELESVAIEHIPQIRRNFEIIQGRISDLSDSRDIHSKTIDRLISDVAILNGKVAMCRGCRAKDVESDSRADELITVISGLKEKGEIDEALFRIKEFIAKYGASPIVWLERANLYLAKGRLDKALESFEKARQFKELGIEPYCGAALILYRQDQLKEAKNVLEECILEHPQVICHEFIDLLSRIYEKIGSVEDVERIGSDMLNIEHPYCTNCALARLYYSVKDYGKAHEHIEKVDTENCIAIAVLRAGVLTKIKDYDGALKNLMEIDPEIHIDFMALGFIHDSLEAFRTEDNCEKLMDFTKKALGWEPHESSNEWLGMLLESLAHRAYHISCSETEFYLNVLEEAHKHHDCSALRQGILFHLKELGQFEKAHDFALDSVDKFPDSPRVMFEACVILDGNDPQDQLSSVLGMAFQFDENLESHWERKTLLRIVRKVDSNLYLEAAERYLEVCKTKHPEQLAGAKKILLDAQNAQKEAKRET